jgi:hypothetical protein
MSVVKRREQSILTDPLWTTVSRLSTPTLVSSILITATFQVTLERCSLIILPPFMNLPRVGFRDRTPFHVQVLCIALSNNDCEAVWTVPEGYTCESFANYASISSVRILEANNPNIKQYCDSMTDIPAGLVRHRSYLVIWS